MPESHKHFTANMPTAALAGLLAFAAVILGIYLFLTWQTSDGRSPFDILQSGKELDERGKLEILRNLSAGSENVPLTMDEKAEILAELSAGEEGSSAFSEGQKLQILEALQQQ
jgi:hypothetical protein